MDHLNNKTPNQEQSNLHAHVQNREAEFIQLILKRLGIITYPNNKELNKIFLNACHKFNYEPDEYLEKLADCPDNSPLMEHLIAGVTVGETYFFRDKNQMHLLKTKVLPTIINKKREQKNLSLRVWSAACASGEEIYTVAILLHELLPDIHRWQIALLGSDINTASLQKARMGLYNKWSLRSTSEYYRQHYFTEMDNQYKLSPKIVDKVQFTYLNLNDNTYPSILNGTNSQDLIICRNVLIYFNRESIAQLMKKLSQSLADGGYLLLGASDPICIQHTHLIPHHHEGMLFSRPDNQTPRMEGPAKITPPLLARPKLLKPALNKPDLKEKDRLNTKEQNSSATQLVSKAKEAANKGRSKEALDYCQQSLKLDSTNKEAYFIYALVLIEINQLSEAETALRKTLYLDNKFVEGHFQLGILLLKEKRYKEGLKALHNALTIVNQNDPSTIVPDSQGLSYERFAELIQAEIELYMTAGSLNNDKKK